MDQMGFEEQVSMTIDDQEIPPPDSETVSSSSTSGQFGYFTQNGMTRVQEGNGEHETIKNIFLKGLGPICKDTNLVAIHKNWYSSFSGRARLETCRIFSSAVAEKCGGNANIKYAWYGASREEICEIVTHGFSGIGKSENGEAYGFGVHLSPVNFASDGVSSSAMDENGLRHMILCRVILGNMEVVCAGSKQFQPSSMEFDSGVDNLSAPRKYIIWSSYMNSHIFPNYIISFRTPCISKRIQCPIPKPSSPYMKFPALLSMLSNFLPCPKMASIVKYHIAYRENQISRIQFIQRLRQLAGDELLMDVIKFYVKKQLELRTNSSASADTTRKHAAGT